jgi:hypothetical protein
MSVLMAGVANAQGPSATTAPATNDQPPDQPPNQPPPGVPITGKSPEPSSPLAIHVGDSELLIGGFMDATSIFRTTNTGNGIGTSFGTIPFKTLPSGAPNVPGNLTEERLSTQNSRITLQATSKWHDVNLKGYIEADFLGNTSTSINVTSNSDTLRMRLYWAQVQVGKFEFLAGQSWSLLTPNRNGLSPMPGDLFYSQDVDTNYQMGLIWERTTGYRFIGHPNDTVAFGVALENPEQYVGSAVVLPTAFNAAQVDTGASNLAATSPVPNAYPDIIGKIAFDPKTGKTHQHIDAAFIVRGYKVFNPANSTEYTATGSGGSVNFVLEPVPNFRVIATNWYDNGSGRLISNTNLPDFIVNADQSLSLVKSWSGIWGAEITAHNTLLYGYYSYAHAEQNIGFDTNGTTRIGFGVPNSQSANHKISEPTVGFTQTFFRDPKIGGMLLMVQYSWVERTPYSVPAGTPGKATTHMVYVNVRYLLP